MMTIEPDNQFVVRETAGPESLRLRIPGSLSQPRLTMLMTSSIIGATSAQSISNALKVYANRPLFGTRVRDSNGAYGHYKVCHTKQGACVIL